MAISTNGTVLARLAGALYNTQMSNATYKEVAALDPSALADVLYSRDFSSVKDATVATTLVTNLGLTSITGLDNWIAAQLTAAGSHKGAKIVELLNGFAQMTADAVYGSYAVAFNSNVDAALALSQATDNAGGTFAAAGVVSGKTFTLTTNVEQVAGSAGNDTFYGTHTTLTSGDALTGGNGSDTLNVTTNTASGTAYTALPTLSGIETISVTNLNAGTDTDELNLVNSSGVTNLVNKSSSQNVTFSNVQEAAKITVDGATAGTTSVTFKNALAIGTSDSLSVEVKNGATAVFEATGVTTSNVFETVNLSSTGATKNTVSFAATTAAGLKTVNASGAGDLTVSLEKTAAKGVYDGSTGTGKQTIAIAAGDTGTASAFYVETVKTGSGNDVIDITDLVGGSQAATTYFGSTAAKSIDAGAGTDTLIVSESVTALTSSSATGVLHSVTGVETIEGKFANATSSATTPAIYADLFPSSSVYGALATSSSGANTLSVTRLGADQKVQLSGTQSSTGVNNLTVSQKVAVGTADAITVELISPNTNTTTTTPSANVLGTITVNTSTDSAYTETLNVVATNASFTAAGATSATVGNTIAAVTAQSTSNLVVSGAGGVTISGLVDLKTPTGAATQNIDASGLTGTFTLGAIGTAGVEDVAVSVKGGSGTNKYYFNATIGSTDVVIGGAGTDTLYVTDSTTAATIAPTTTSVENLSIRTVSGGAKSFSLANTTGLTTVNLNSDGGTAAISAAAYGTTVSSINGQTVNFVTAAAGTSSGSATQFASTTTNLRGATGVANVTATIKGDGTAISNPTIATNVGQITIQDSNVIATTGYYVDESVTVAGTSATGDATPLSKVVLSGGGLKDATTRAKITLAASASAGVTAITAVDASAAAGDIDVSGTGLEAGATVTLGATGTNTTTVAAAQLAADAAKIVGGAGTNTVAVTGVTGATALRPNMTSVETVSITTVNDSDSALADLTADFRDSSSATKVKLLVAIDSASAGNIATNDQSITLNNLANNATVTLSGADTDGTYYGTGSDTLTIAAPVSGATAVTITNESAAGAVTVLDAVLGSTYTSATVRQAASQNIAFTTLEGTGLTSLTVGGSAVSSTSGLPYAGTIGVATLTAGNLTGLTVDTTEGAITVGNTALTAAKLATVTASGANAFTLGGSTATTTALATFDASTVTGDVTIGQGVDFTTSASIKGGSGSDTIWMNIQSYANVTVDAGANSYSSGSLSTSGKDNLKLQGAMNSGLTVVDLSSTTDQLTQANGAVNTATQVGFESVDASALTGSFAINVTGSNTANVIVGTANADNIFANGGADIITGGAGADTIDLTETISAADTVVFNDAASSDTITGFTCGADLLKFIDASGALTLAGTATATVYKDTVSALTASTMSTGGNVLIITDAVTQSASVVGSTLKVIDAGTATLTNGMIVITAASTGDVKIWYDGTASTDTASDTVLLATLTGVALADLANMLATNVTFAAS